VPFDVSEDMAKVLRIRTVRRGDIPEIQPLSRLLHEVHELVDLEEAHEWIHEPAEVTIHEADKDRAARRHRWRIPERF
jgi:hypothetical protein